MGNEGANTSRLPSASIPPAMSAPEHELWQKYIQERCGLYFSESRLRFLRQRLWERMRALGCKTYGEYYHYVAYNAHGPQEWAQILELLLNHETGFFRHLPSFEALNRFVLPELMKEKRRHGVNQITLWSAGCSTGQEAYSLAMALTELFAGSAPDAIAPPSFGAAGAGWQIKVFGTDINPHALDKARRGQYKPSDARYMPELYRQRYLAPFEDEKGAGGYRVIGSVRAMTQFGYLNLCDPESYWVSAQDVIFCQNVLLYFEPESRLETVKRLCQRLNPGGYLFLAPAEVVGLKLPNVQLVREPDALIYQRKA